MTKTKYSPLLEDVVNDQVPSTLNLAPQILSRLEKGKRNNMKKSMKVVISTVAALLIMAVVSFTIPVVAQAIQHWFGYVPGFGFVGNETLRTMDAPVSVEQKGFTLTVNKVVSSSEKTLITYALKDISPEMLSDNTYCFGPNEDPKAILPDGSELTLQGLGTSPNGSVMQYEITFSGLPADVDQFTLKLSCLDRIRKDAVPQQWEVILTLGNGPQSELTPLPIIDVTAAPTDTAGLVNALQVLQIVPLEDGALLAGTLDVSAKDGWIISEDDGFLDGMTVTDGNGNCVPVSLSEYDFSANLSAEQTAGKIPWAAKVEGSDFAWPLTINVASVSAIGADYTPATFQVDLGTGLQPGEVLPLELDVPLGDKILHVISVTRMELQNSDAVYYNFAFSYDPSFDFSYQIEGYFPMGGGGSGDFGAGPGSCEDNGPKPGDTIYLARAYKDNLPSGLVTIDLTGHPVMQVEGPWQVVIEQPAIP